MYDRLLEDLKPIDELPPNVITIRQVGYGGSRIISHVYPDHVARVRYARAMQDAWLLPEDQCLAATPAIP